MACDGPRPRYLPRFYFLLAVTMTVLPGAVFFWLLSLFV